MLLALFGCHESIESPAKPDNLIPEDKMVDIMYDVFLLNSAKGVNKKLLELNGIYPENYVFEKYGIDSTQFANSNNYYAYDTKTYESILERIKERINVEKKKYEAVEKVEEETRMKRADSIKKARVKLKDSLIKLKKLPLREPKKKNQPISNP